MVVSGAPFPVSGLPPSGGGSRRKTHSLPTLPGTLARPSRSSLGSADRVPGAPTYDLATVTSPPVVHENAPASAPVVGRPTPDRAGAADSPWSRRPAPL